MTPRSWSATTATIALSLSSSSRSAAALAGFVPCDGRRRHHWAMASSSSSSTRLSGSLRDIMDDRLNFKNGKKKTTTTTTPSTADAAPNGDAGAIDDDGGTAPPTAAASAGDNDDDNEGDERLRQREERRRRQREPPQQPDMMTMGISEIKRELRLYGIATDDASLDRRAWEGMLSRERRMRGGSGGGGGGRGKVEDDDSFVVAAASSASSSLAGDVLPGTTGAAVTEEEEETTAIGIDDPPYRDDDDDDDWDGGRGEEVGGEVVGGDAASPADGPKLRELRIAYEFERVQAQYPIDDDDGGDNDGDGSPGKNNAMRLRAELESRFGLSTRYFLGTREMAYALAVARVDDAVERLRLGIESDDDEWCIVEYEDYNKNHCRDDALPTPEELIEMEYDNLLQHPSWFDDENDALSSELESQYGIPAKHFMGKREMAYALAVERVDRAMKEGGGYIMDDDEEEAESGSGDAYEPVIRTDEDMMRMMEEEMWKEEEEEEEELRRLREEVEEIRRATTDLPVGGEDAATTKKSFKKEEPNPFQKKTAAAAAAYQTTPLADMIKGADRRERRPQPKRTPLSSEPPRSFGRERQNQQQRSRQQQYQYGGNSERMGTVIGGDPTPLVTTTTTTSSTAVGGSSVGGIPKADAKSKLADILKGSEEHRRRQQQQQRTRSRATTPPPQPKMQERMPRSVAFTTMSSRYDDSFVPTSDGGRGGVNNIINDGRGYDTPWDGGAYGVIPPPNDYFGVGYTASWDRGATASRPYSSSATTTAATKRSSAATQRPFEPAPFTEPGTHNANGGGRASSRPAGGAGAVGGPKRVPPQTPFTSPVTDGARRSGGVSSSSSSSSSYQAGPTFTPFTAPGKRSTNGKPPPRKQTSSDPRKFNIKDTPDTTQPFVGVGWSQAYVDQYTSYSPPLQVDPPPRDPDREAKMKDNPYYFEPAPFSSPQPHAVHSGAFARPPRDKWNRVQNNNPSSSSVPPRNNSNQGQHRQGRQERSKKGQRSGPSSPFDNLRDMFSSIKPGGNKEDKANKEEPRGFKSGNVEVFPSSDTDGWWPSSSGSGRYQQDGMRHQAVEVEIINAKRKIKTTDWQIEDEDDIDPSLPLSSAEMFENAWKGGPASAAASTTFTPNNGMSGETLTPRTDNKGENCSMNDATQRKARELLAANPEIRDIVIRAQSNEKLRKAVIDCTGNPKSFGQYWDDPIVGPILSELKRGL